MFYCNQCTYFKQRLCQYGLGLIPASCHMRDELNCCWFSLCSEGFSPCPPVFILPEKPTFQIPSNWRIIMGDPHENQLLKANAPSSLTGCNLRYFFPVG